MQMWGVLFTCFPDRVDAIMDKLMADEVPTVITALRAVPALCCFNALFPIRSRQFVSQSISPTSCVTAASTPKGHPHPFHILWPSVACGICFIAVVTAVSWTKQSPWHVQERDAVHAYNHDAEDLRRRLQINLGMLQRRRNILTKQLQAGPLSSRL